VRGLFAILVSCRRGGFVVGFVCTPTEYGILYVNVWCVGPTASQYYYAVTGVTSVIYSTVVFQHVSAARSAATVPLKYQSKRKTASRSHNGDAVSAPPTGRRRYGAPRWRFGAARYGTGHVGDTTQYSATALL